MYGAGVIAGIIALSAVIAFIGDWVGRRFGKLRLSLFGLRPRHTAVVVSVLTGMFIAAFTLGTALALSEYARVGMLRARELLAQQRRLSRLNEALRRESKRLRKNLRRTKEQMRHLRVAVSLARERLSEARRNLFALRRRAEAAERRLKVARERLRKVEGQLSKVEAQRDALEAELSQRLRELSELEEKRRLTEEEYRQALSRIEALHQRISALNRERKRLEEERKKLTDEVGRLAEEATRLRREVEQLQRVIAQVRTGTVTFHMGEALAFAVLEGGTPVEEALDQLRRLLESANNLAIKRGAAIDEEGWGVRLVSPRGEVYDVDERLRTLAEKVAKSHGGVVVRLLALRNCVEGEQVVADFFTLPNRLIFKEGETVAEGVVDGRKPPEEIFEDLIRLLRIDAARTASERGLLRQPTGEFGRASYREVFKAVNKLRKLRRRARVKVVAISDTYTAGPLVVRFEVEPLE